MSDLGAGIFILHSCLKGILLLLEGNINSLKGDNRDFYRQKKLDLDLQLQDHWNAIQAKMSFISDLLKT